MGESKIEWTERTWNPIVGCSILTPGCTNCYAMKMAARLEVMGNVSHYAGTTKKVKGKAVWTGKLALAPGHTLLEPLFRKKPTTYFVNSMGDLFHEDAPYDWIAKAFYVMAQSPRHTFQVLTKRAARMREIVSDPSFAEDVRGTLRIIDDPDNRRFRWPLPNVWLGVSAERQQEADERIPHLLQTPAAIRFVSAEPLIERISFRWAMWKSINREPGAVTNHLDGLRSLDWIIVGGESGNDARPFHVEWADEIVVQCHEAHVACFVKQLGSMPMSSGYPYPLKSRKGGDPDEWPMRLAIREMPSLPSALAAPQNKPAQAHPAFAEATAGKP